MEQKLSKKVLHICINAVILVAIFFGVGMSILKYHVEGETNLPFNISKIAIISNTEGKDQEGTNKWNLSLNQNNDIYIYMEKNNEYKKVEVIESVTLENFKIINDSNIGEKNIYRPKSTGTSILKNKEEYKVEKLEYIGDLESDIRNLKISNQGGIILFRYSLDNIGTYASDTDEEIKFDELLKKTNIKMDDLKSKISFDIIIKLKSGKSFKANIELDTPSGDIVEEGTSNIEITDLNNIVFKRIEN